MANTKNGWLGAGTISVAVVVLGAVFFGVTASHAEQLPTAWARVLALRLSLATVVWAITVFSNRRKLGLRECFEIGVLLLIGGMAFGLGRIFADGRVAPVLANLNLGSLSTAMFLSGALIAAIALNMVLRLVRLRAILQRSRHD